MLALATRFDTAAMNVTCQCKHCGAELVRPRQAAKYAICETCRRKRDAERTKAYSAKHPEVRKAGNQKYREKLRGGRPPFTKEELAEISRRNQKLSMTPEARAKLVATRRERQSWKSSLEKARIAGSTPEAQARRIAAMRASKKFQEALSRTGRINVKLAHEGCKKSSLCQPGETNCHAKWWIVRDPMRRVHTFLGAAEFVRRNPHLFAPEDLVWKKGNCRATLGLSRIRPHLRAKTRGTWKGWQWVSTLEGIRGENDLLVARLQRDPHALARDLI
jgi:hypothetical protein